MPKSKELLDSDDDVSSSDEKPKKKARVERPKREEAKNSKTTKPASKTVQKPISKSKPKAEEPEEDEEAEAENKSDSNDENSNDGMYMLAKMRFASVSEFRGKAFVNIREYYEKDGKQLPGKKGISLSTDQWENLKKNIAKIDNDLKKY